MAFYKCSVSIWTQVRLQVLTVGAAAELWPHRWEQRCLLLTFHFRDSLWNGGLGCRLVFPPFDRRRMNGSLLIPTFRCLDLWLFWLRVRGQFAGHAQGAQLRQWQSSVQIRRQLLLLTHVAALRLQRLTMWHTNNMVNGWFGKCSFKHCCKVRYLQRVTAGQILVDPALLLLFLLLLHHSSTSCFRRFLFPGQTEPLSLSFPIFRVIRVLHCLTQQPEWK